MPLDWKKPEDRLIIAGSLIVYTVFMIGLALTTSVASRRFSLWLIFDYAEVIGVGGLITLALQITFNPHSLRPLTWVPPEGRWWEYVILGAFTMIRALGLMASALAALVVLPILVPIKVIYKYTLSTSASLWSALLAVPIVVLCVSFAFTLLYFVSALTKRGSLLSKNERLFAEIPYGPPLAETFRFSTLIMLGRDSGYIEATGACRWILFAQLFAAKIIDILIVSVGIALIVGKFPALPVKR